MPWPPLWPSSGSDPPSQPPAYLDGPRLVLLPPHPQPGIGDPTFSTSLDSSTLQLHQNSPAVPSRSAPFPSTPFVCPPEMHLSPRWAAPAHAPQPSARRLQKSFLIYGAGGCSLGLLPYLIHCPLGPAWGGGGWSPETHRGMCLPWREQGGEQSQTSTCLRKWRGHFRTLRTQLFIPGR